ncbi:MAG: MATE family efflux transporter [Chloroflexota bacterium]
MKNTTPNNNHNVLNDDRIGLLLLKLAAPAFFGMFVMTLYNVVDTIFIGHFVGPLAIAALSIAFPLQILTMGIGMMVGLGGASLMSRLIGAGDTPRAERALGNSITADIILSLLLTVVILANLGFWLRLIGASDEVLPYARDYLSIVISGAVTATFGMALVSFIRSEGNARVGMTGMIIGAGLNIVLDAIFIIPLGWGVKGAALATVIAQVVSLAYLLSYYITGTSYLKIRTPNLKPELAILRSIFAIGVASFVRTVATSLTAMFIIRTIVTYGGDFSLSAFGIIQRIMMFAFMPSMVIGQGLQPILGYNYGARRFDRARRAITIAIVAATACSVLVFLVVYFIPQPIIGIFTGDASIIELGTFAARRIFLALPLLGFIMVSSLVFQSIGKAAESFVTAIVRPVAFLVPLVIVLPRYWQLDGVWFAFPIADTLTFLLTLLLIIPVIRGFKKAGT